MDRTYKIKWRVQEAPTGPFRSFEKRGWPVGNVNDQAAFAISCADDYIPTNVKTGNHAELTIRVAIRVKDNPSFTWRQLKQRATTLAEAKEIAAKFLATNLDRIFPNG